MKHNNPIRFAALSILALVIAASPYQTGETGAQLDPYDAILGGIIGALGAGLAWLWNELRKLKAQAIAQVRLFMPDAWEWVLDDLAPILVRAVCQALPQTQAENIIIGFQLGFWRELEIRGIVVPAKKRQEVAALFQETVAQFYRELKTSTLYPTD